MEAKGQYVQKSASAQYTLMTGDPASKISLRIGWIGDNEGGESVAPYWRSATTPLTRL